MIYIKPQCNRNTYPPVAAAQYHFDTTKTENPCHCPVALPECMLLLHNYQNPLLNSWESITQLVAKLLLLLYFCWKFCPQNQQHNRHSVLETNRFMLNITFHVDRLEEAKSNTFTQEGRCMQFQILNPHQ